MSDQRVVRPSIKLVIAAYVFIFILLAVAAFALYEVALQQPHPAHLLALLLFLYPIKKHIEKRFIHMEIGAERLTLDKGLLSRSRRTFDLAKVQDVTARQSIAQRLLGTGDLMLETAGESGAMTIHGIDQPRAVADLILERSRAAVGRHRGQGGGL